MMRRMIFLIGLAGCVSSGFSDLKGRGRVSLTFEGTQNLGTRETFLPLPLERATSFKVRIRALIADGTPDTSFSRYVRLSVKPGNVQSVSGPLTEGRNAYLTNGVSELVTVNIQGSFGKTRIIAEDLGYVPVDPQKALCADGVDNDGDGVIDNADDGCAFPNDDTEESASFVGGASPPIYFALPRVADVRGRSFDAQGNAIGGGATAFPKQQIEIDTGYRESPNPDGTTKTGFAFSTVVTRISSDGFNVTDLGETTGFGSIFAFNFNSPPGMRVCDRLKTYRGTASDFFGSSQISFPTWTVEEWNPQERPCLVPEPTVLRAADLMVNGAFADQQSLLRQLAGLVRVETTERSELRVTRHFGRGDGTCTLIPTFNPATDLYQYNCTFGDDASNCDLNKDGRIDFATEPEKSCGAACSADPECSEWSNYTARAVFQLIVLDRANNIRGKIQADATASSTFRALELRGKAIRSFSGALRFFSGGTQFTIEARCKDDIVVAVDSEVPPIDKTCVFPRTIVDNNSGAQ